MAVNKFVYPFTHFQAVPHGLLLMYASYNLFTINGICSTFLGNDRSSVNQGIKLEPTLQWYTVRLSLEVIHPECQLVRALHCLGR